MNFYSKDGKGLLFLGGQFKSTISSTIVYNILNPLDGMVSMLEFEGDWDCGNDCGISGSCNSE